MDWIIIFVSSSLLINEEMSKLANISNNNGKCKF